MAKYNHRVWTAVALMVLVPSCAREGTLPIRATDPPPSTVSEAAPSTEGISTTTTTTATTTAPSSTSTAVLTTVAPLSTSGKPLGLAIDDVTAIAVGQSGLVAFATSDGALAIVEPGSEEPSVIKAHTPLTDIAIAIDGELIITSDEYGSLQGWMQRAGSWETVWSKESAHRGPIMAIDVVTDQNVLLSAGNDRSVKRWIYDESGIQNDGEPLDFGQPISDMALSPDGQVIAVVSSRSALMVADESSIQVLPIANVVPNALAFLSNRELLVSGSDRVLQVDIDAESLNDTPGTPLFSESVTAIAISRSDADEPLVVAGGGSNGVGQIVAWRGHEPERAILVAGLLESPTAVAFDRTNSRVYGADRSQSFARQLKQ